MPDSLSTQTRKRFKSIGHTLNPVIIITNKGLSSNIIEDIDTRLEKNELIKIKVSIPDSEKKAQILDTICSTLDAQLIQKIGHVALLYRSADQPDPKLSNLIRHGI
jgi:RNA-binding protein